LKQLINHLDASMQEIRDLSAIDSPSIDTSASSEATPAARTQTLVEAVAAVSAGEETADPIAAAGAQSNAPAIVAAETIEAAVAHVSATAAPTGEALIVATSAAAAPGTEAPMGPIEAPASSVGSAAEASIASPALAAAAGESESAAAKTSQTREAPTIEPPRATLIPFVAPSAARTFRIGALGRFASDRRLQAGAAAACLALVAVAAAGAGLDRVAKSQHESQGLAQAVSALSTRIDAIDAAKPREEAVEIRKAVSEARGGLATSRDLSATVAQLNARLDRLEREQQARLDKLNERVEHDVAARNADAQARSVDLASRIEKLEKADFASRIDKIEKADLGSRLDKVEKRVAPQTVAATPPTPPAAPRDATAAAPAPGVSNEVTGSIERPHPTAPIRGWVLTEVRNGAALVANRQGLHEIEPGDVLPGAGKVQRFEKRGREWVVVTDQGIIVQAEYAPRVVVHPPIMGGPYGGYDED
jgi:hypothetical protein